MRQVINIFRRNLLKKIIALIVAFIMWIFVMNDQDPPTEDDYDVPLTISNQPYELIPIFQEKIIKLRVRAPRSYFVKYDTNAFRVYANLEGMGEGVHQIDLQVITPQGFEVVDKTPESVRITLDPLIERRMPIEILTTGNIAQDAAVKEINKSIDSVTVVGPKSFVEHVDKVFGTLNLNNNASSFEIQVPMNAVDNKGDALPPSVHVVPSVITVGVDVESGVRKRIVPVIPNLSVADGWELTKITSDPPQVEVVGTESAISSIITIRTVPFTVQTGQRVFKGTLKLEIPEGVTIPVEEVNVTASVIRKPVIRDGN